MAVKIRLARRGRKKLAMYDVVITQSRAPRDGVFIEKIGTYNPLTNPATINLNEERALDWIMKGAQPSDTVRAMLSYKGILIRKHLQVGVIKGAITQEEADKRFAEWKTVKDAKINAKIEKLTSERDALLKDRHEKEIKVNESRAAALRQKQAARLKEEAAKSAPKQTEAEEAAPVAEVQAEPVAEEKVQGAPAAEAVEKSAPEAGEESAPEASASAGPENSVEPDEAAKASE